METPVRTYLPLALVRGAVAANFPVRIPQPNSDVFWDAVDMFLSEVKDLGKYVQRALRDDFQAVSADWEEG